MVFLFPKIRGVPVYVAYSLLPRRECDRWGTREFGQWSRHWHLANILSDPVQIQCTLTSCGKACEHLSLISSYEHSWAWHHQAMSTHESVRVVLSMVQLGQGSSLALMAVQHHTHKSSWVHLSAHEHLGAVMRAHESSWELVSADVIDWIVNKRC